mgnify:CR=1 FL=1
MADNYPQVGFTFPYRWLNEDIEFLDKNLSNMVLKSRTSVPMHPKLQKGYSPSYYAILKFHAYKPWKKEPLSKTRLQKALKQAMGGAICSDLQIMFVQTQNPTSLPVMELQLFF